MTEIFCMILYSVYAIYMQLYMSYFIDSKNYGSLNGWKGHMAPPHDLPPNKFFSENYSEIQLLLVPLPKKHAYLFFIPNEPIFSLERINVLNVTGLVSF